MNHSGQFGQGVPAAPMHPGHEAGGQSLNAAGYGYDQYQPISSGSGANNLSVSTTPASTPHSHNYNSEGDVPMEDADPYNRAKYPSRPAHHHRASSQYIAHEGSAAAQRYSPMNMLNAAGQFTSSPNSQSQPQAQAGYTYQSHTPRSRQSPTRQNHLGSPQQYMDSPSKYKTLPYVWSWGRS
jgi:dual specificity protein kinase YAK1